MSGGFSRRSKRGHLNHLRSAIEIVALAPLLVIAAIGQEHIGIPEPVTRYAIARFLIEGPVDSVESFVAGLPTNHKRDFELSIDSSIHRGRDASTTMPWVVAKGSDSRFVFGWSTDPVRTDHAWVRWIASIESEVEAGYIDFSGIAPRLQRSLSCLGCRARASGDGEMAEPVFRTMAADDSTRDMLLQTLKDDNRIAILEVAPLEAIQQADWQPLAGVDWTHSRRDTETRFALAANNTVEVDQFVFPANSNLEVRTESDAIEEVQFAIARLGSASTWIVETDRIAPWTLADLSGYSAGSKALQQTGQYWLQVRAFATNDQGESIASVPLDLAYRIENGSRPTAFGSVGSFASGRAATSLGGPGSVSGSPSTPGSSGNPNTGSGRTCWFLDFDGSGEWMIGACPQEDQLGYYGWHGKGSLCVASTNLDGGAEHISITLKPNETCESLANTPLP